MDSIFSLCGCKCCTNMFVIIIIFKLCWKWNSYSLTLPPLDIVTVSAGTKLLTLRTFMKQKPALTGRLCPATGLMGPQLVLSCWEFLSGVARIALTQRRSRSSSPSCWPTVMNRGSPRQLGCSDISGSQETHADTFLAFRCCLTDEDRDTQHLFR